MSLKCAHVQITAVTMEVSCLGHTRVYKIRLDIAPYGRGPGRDSHISVNVHSIEGDYESLLALI